MLKRIFVTILALILTLQSVSASAASGSKVIVDEYKSLDMLYNMYNVSAQCYPLGKYRDTSRVVRPRKDGGVVVYKYTGLQSLELIAYETINSTGIVIEFSKNDKDWVEFATERVVLENSKWNKVRYRVNAAPEGYSYVKATMNYPGDNDVSADEIQLGEMRFKFDADGSLLDAKLPTSKGLTAVYNQDFQSIPYSWDIDEASKEYVTTEDYNGGKALVLSTELPMLDKAGCTNPQISAFDLGLAGNIYRLTFKIAADNAAFDRNIIIGTDKNGAVGQYLYPISFSSNGRIGYRNSEFEFEDFDTPYPYEPDRIYEISVLIDTVNAMEKVYIDGVKIGGDYELNSSADGGIYSIKFSNADTPNVSGKTYIDSMICENKSNMQDIFYGEVSFDDMENHWARVYAEQLVYQGATGLTVNFEPERNITAGELYGWILTALGKSYGGDALAKAKSEGLDFSQEFTSNTQTVTRQQMIGAIEKVFNSENVLVNVYNNTYSDMQSVGARFMQSVKNMLSLGVLSAENGAALRPEDNATRAESAAVFAKMLSPELRVNLGYVVGIYADSKWEREAKLLEKKLSSGFDVRIINDDDILNPDVMNPDVMSCVILLNKINTTKRGINVLRGYLEEGGDVVSCGKDIVNAYNNYDFKIPMFEGFEWKPYMYDKAVKLATANGQADFTEKYELAGKFTGTTAVGFVNPTQSKYIPVLEAFNQFGKSCGYAAGVLVEYDGMYKGGNWMMCGVYENDFYTTDTFLKVTYDVLKKFESGALSEKYVREDELEKNKKALAAFEITEPRPEGYVSISEDGSHFIDAHGEEMFVVGASVFGPSEFMLGMGNPLTGTFDIEKVDNFFRLASEAGINVFRWWHLWRLPLDTFEGQQAVKVLINCARKYNIYLYFVAPGHALDYQTLPDLEKAMKILKDEPMLLGFDLNNEPSSAYILVHFGGVDEKNPILKYDLVNRPELAKWKDTFNYLMTYKGTEYAVLHDRGVISDELHMAMAAADTLIKKELFGDGQNYYEFDLHTNTINENAPQYLKDMTTELLTYGYGKFSDVVDKYHPQAYITVGHHTFTALWPGNGEAMDWWNHHMYSKPNSYDEVMRGLAVFDRLNSVSKIPVVFGEFGLSGGHVLDSGKMVDYETTAASDFLTFLYPYAKGYGGAVNWNMETKNPINYRYYRSGYTEAAGWDYMRDIYVERHGSYVWDGNPEMQYKIRHTGVATKDFAEFRKRHKIGDGELEIHEADTEMKLEYTYMVDDARYICANSYESGDVQFKMPDGKQPIVMMNWYNENEIRITSTQDMTIKIKTKAFWPDMYPYTAKVTGNLYSYNVEEQFMVLNLAECEEVVITKGEDNMVCVDVAK